MRAHFVAYIAAAMTMIVALPSGAVATNYFVATGGNDRNPGTADRPWATLQQAANVARAGDVVLIRAGHYRQRALFAAAGRADAPIRFSAESDAVIESPNPADQTEGLAVHTTAAYLQLVGFEVGGGFAEGILVRAGAHHIEIRDCRLHDNRVGVAVGSASQITIAGCSLYRNGRAGLRLAGEANDITVIDTSSFNNDDGRGCDGESDGFVIDSRGVRNVSFVRTRAVDNGEDGYDLLGADLTLDQVESRGGCTGMKLRDSASISNCLMANSRNGIKTTALSSTTHFNISNCTLVDQLFPIVLGAPSRPIRRYSVDLFNNIVVAPNRALDYDASVELREGHNIFWRGDQSGALIRILPDGGELSGRSINDGGWSRFSGQGVGTLSVDPLLHDPANNDFAPQALSPAVDRGEAAHAPLTDLNGTSRPQGSGPDIGAIETLGAAANHPPQAAMSVRRDLFGRINRPNYFDASASFDPDGDAVTFSWDFGDGSGAASQARVGHAYRASGLYTATLTVSDGQLSSQASTTINVGNVRTPLPTLPRGTSTPSAPQPTPTAPPPAASPTATLAPTPAAPSNVMLSFSGPGVGSTGKLVTFSLRYRGLSGPAAITIALPNDLTFDSALPAVAHASGNLVIWENPPSGAAALKIKARVAATAARGAYIDTTVNLRETDTGRVAVRSATTLIQ
jgi:hypothetical protein